MILPLINRRQAIRLKKLGYNWKGRDLFILNSIRNYITDSMDTEENWNQYPYTLSRPSIALALQWIRIKYNCKCEVTILSWENEQYGGVFKLNNMKEYIITRTFPDREKAESELLTRILEYISTHIR